MGSGVLTTRRTSACASENKSVREAAAAAELPVRQVTAEVRRVTLKRSSASSENRGSKKRKSRELNANDAPQVRSFPLQRDVTRCDITCPSSWYLTRHVGPVRDNMDPAAN